MSRALSKRQQKFVEELLADPKMRQTEAAIKAGFSKKNADSIAARLVKRPAVKAAIEAAMAARAERTKITADYVLENLTEIVERCMQRAPVMVRMGRHLVQMTDEEGRHVWKFDAAGSTTALGLIGRHLGMFNDKLEVTDGERPLLDLSDEELIKKARGDG